MSLGSENGLSVADIAAVTDRNNGNCGNGWGGGFGEMLIAMIMLFLFPMFFGGFGGGMWGGMGGWGNGGMMAAANGALTRADLCSEFNFNGLENAVRGVTQGLCDGFYAMQNSINSLGMNVMQGFSQAELSQANQQAALMQQLNNLGYQHAVPAGWRLASAAPPDTAGIPHPEHRPPLPSRRGRGGGIFLRGVPSHAM